MNVFFTSDLHFGHERVNFFDNRGFNSVEEMNEELINRWNKKVNNNDIVYVIGDMFFRCPNQKIYEILNRLKGRIILVKGNHDHWIKNNNLTKRIEDIVSEADISVRLKDGTVRRCFLHHCFVPMYIGARHNGIHLHGHSHNSPEHYEELRIARELNEKGFHNQIYNVGCMHWNYEPVTLDEILSTK